MNNFAGVLRNTLCALVLVLVVGSGALMAQVSISIPSISVVPGETLKIPVNVGDITADSVGSYQFVVTCDTTIIRFTGVDVAGTISEAWGATAN